MRRSALYGTEYTWLPMHRFFLLTEDEWNGVEELTAEEAAAQAAQAAAVAETVEDLKGTISLSPEPQSMYTVNAGEAILINLGTPISTNGEEVNVSIEYDGISFVNFDDSTM